MRLGILGLCYLGLLVATSGMAAAHGNYTCVSGVCAYAEPLGTHHNPHTYVDTYGPTGTIVQVYARYDIGLACVGAAFVHTCLP